MNPFPLVALLLHLAPASVAELVDIGPAMGRVGAVSSRVTGGAAAYYNPSGLAFRSEPQLRIGVQTLWSQLSVRGDPVDVGAPYAVVVEVATMVPLLAPLEDLLAVGVTIMTLPDNMLEISAPAFTDPVLPYYQNRTQRLVVMPAVALKLHRTFAIGVGMNYFSGLTGIANVTEASDGTVQADVEEEIFAAATGHAGIRFQGEHLSLAVTYRQRFTVNWNTVSHSYLADSDLELQIRSRSLYTPETVVFAASWNEERFDLSADVSWRRWSRYAAPFARVSADAPLPSLTGEEQRLITESDFTKPKTRDVWRLAISGHGRLFGPGDYGLLDLSGGYAYEPSPFNHEEAELETSAFNVIDGPKHILGLGVRYRLPDLGRARFTIDLASQLHWVGEIWVAKDPSVLTDEDPYAPGRQTTNLGYPDLTGGGWLLAGMASVTFELLPAVEAGEP